MAPCVALRCVRAKTAAMRTSELPTPITSSLPCVTALPACTGPQGVTLTAVARQVPSLHLVVEGLVLNR